MNCKPNCLAIRVRKSICGAVPAGAIVETLRLVPEARMNPKGEIACNVWDVRWNGEELGPNGYELGVPDSDLKMIDNPDGQDETLTWAGLPQPSKETTT